MGMYLQDKLQELGFLGWKINAQVVFLDMAKWFHMVLPTGMYENACLPTILPTECIFKFLKFCQYHGYFSVVLLFTALIMNKDACLFTYFRAI